MFGANTLTNQVDLTASARAGAVRRGLHDAASNLARLLGILTAPWFFTRHVAPSRSVFLALLGAGALGALAVGVTFSSRPHGEGRAWDEAGASRVALSPRDRLLGLSYGFFLAEVREWCSRGAREEGKTALLTLFNNMTNLSSLVAFATMLLLAVAARQIGRPVFGPLLGIIG